MRSMMLFGMLVPSLAFAASSPQGQGRFEFSLPVEIKIPGPGPPEVSGCNTLLGRLITQNAECWLACSLLLLMFPLELVGGGVMFLLVIVLLVILGLDLLLYVDAIPLLDRLIGPIANFWSRWRLVLVLVNDAKLDDGRRDGL
ncbi:uncharacterized protein N7473_001703 [Penicillium subrubescens]|uniref:uncharacterized protein n=1 Tax=Penicillium subrubescens TaxID=1316194 RepID=UPI00254516DD|nr:uncharacterized protein N7473_001703 [Penicillium subrubescens]KAJ5904787.1 hypothetical protein N7473_001703 [Penicillium subrubescens]